MSNKVTTADFVFEVSWEVCNKVGGIHTVLSSVAPTMVGQYGKNVIFVGPDLVTDEFVEDPQLLPLWNKALENNNLHARIGRWNIPSNPVAILIDTRQALKHKNLLYADMWNSFGVDSLHAYGDYDEASLWAYAAGLAVECIVTSCLPKSSKVVLQAHEWLSSMALLHIKKSVSKVATVFTTHATSIGRSICGNGKCLYKYLDQYDGDVMARELNMQSKHSAEKAAALNADCFTTVSSSTDKECKALLGKSADVVLPNGFDTSVVPPESRYKTLRSEARKKILNVCGLLIGKKLADNTFIISTSGRNDYRSKGFDEYLEAMKRLNDSPELSTDVVALVEVPCWVDRPRQDLMAAKVMAEDTSKESHEVYNWAMDNPFITHWLHNLDYDRIVCTIRSLGLDKTTVSGKVHVVLIPTYIDGKDGIFNMLYYDMLTACDMTVYPSYYEPWGYTPMESAAFHIPTVTTDLVGFGLWVNNLLGHKAEITDGIAVVHRDDDNYFEVAEEIKNIILQYCGLPEQKRKAIKASASEIVKHAEWKKFIENYNNAFSFAIKRADERRK